MSEATQNGSTQIEAYRRAVQVAKTTLDHLQTKIDTMTATDTWAESEIHAEIVEQIQSHAQCQPLHCIVQGNDYHPRNASPHAALSAQSPVLKVDIGVAYQEGGNVGIADISDTFFFPLSQIDSNPQITQRYQDLHCLYELSQGMVRHIQDHVAPGISADALYRKASQYFDSEISPRLVERGITTGPSTLGRNIGHWISDYVEGPNLIAGELRVLKPGDILCLELPIGSKSLDLSVNFEIEGVVTNTGFDDFTL